MTSDLAPPGLILTAGTPVAEADWLGGLPFYLTYQLAGFSGLMLLKFVAVGLLLYFLLKRFEEQLNWISFFIVVLALMAANTGWQPTPRLLDCWFFYLTWILTERWSREPDRKKILSILFLLVLWANSSPLCLLGLAVVVIIPCLPGNQKQNVQRRKKLSLLILTSFIALMITPRGWYTPYDSLIQILPVLFYDNQLLALTVWHPTFQNGATIEVISLGVMTIGTALFLILYSTSWIETVAFLVFAIPGWMNYDSLPPCIIGITLLLGHCMLSKQVPINFLNLKQNVPPALGRLFLILGILFLSWKAASGVLPGQSQRLGWGIAPELDITLLNQTIGPIDYEGTGHCMGIASTGMLSWIKPDRKIRPVRTLRQALLQGRLFEELSLNQELSNGWEFQKPRSNGSWGGWWIRLKNRNCQLLLVPNGDSKTIRALINSRWQPMSVDASVLPFGWSGEILSSPLIVKLLPVKDFLNRGQWIFSLPSPSGTPECSDWWGIITGDPNMKSALLQAKTFRAMKLYTAALRVLRPLLQDYHTPEVMREFQLCQQELAYQEKLDTGNPSDLRLLTYNKTAEEYDRALDLTGPIIRDLAESQQFPDTFEKAIENYARGNWEAAINLLSTTDSETQYAKARILLESGDPERAAALLQQMIQQHPDDRLVVPSQTLLESIQ
ncbi:tetratricopeptide repeat protein [uncultured Gimesia sp.]|uniref:tetratricopeptide repeat protein n=1 Tax=uncultured Gimesia sp. TaxID=1678688 RepID=UPI00262C3739|nr:tetratricopeptide repeat protein [uncultured Gimesia sp.]